MVGVWGAKNCWALTFDPVHADAIRGFGKDNPEEDITLPNEPIPPRNRQAIKDISRAVGSLGYNTYMSWQADVKILQYHPIQMSMGDRQAGYYRHYAERNRNKIAHYEKITKARLARFPGGDRYTAKWGNLIEDYRAALNRCSERAGPIEGQVIKLRDEHSAALVRCEGREKTYESAIRYLYAPR